MTTSSSVTKVTRPPEQAEFPQMSYTGVTTNRDMANAFVVNLLKAAERMVPEKKWLVDDILAVLKAALDTGSTAAAMLEGRYLRRSLRDQMALSDRYQEPFSVLVMILEAHADESLYQSVLDAVLERLRKSDMIFLYRHRTVMLLPHTDIEAAKKLVARLRVLLQKVIGRELDLDFRLRTYPDPNITSQDEILDWAEEQLR